MAKDDQNELNAEARFTELDFSGFRFPSDGLTIQTIRRLNRGSFDQGYFRGDDCQPRYFLQAEYRGHAADDLGTMLMLERVVATQAYAEAQGVPGPYGWNWKDVHDNLSELLCKYELATGLQHAAEQIRDIARQGRSLGEQIGR